VNRHSREMTVGAALVLLMATLVVFAPNFFEAQPFVSRLASQMPALVAAIGVALVIMTRQIDISVGAQFGMCAVIAGTAAAAGMPMGVAVACALGAGAVMGAANGFLVAYLGLPSIVVTLATMVTWREALRWKQQGVFVNLPDGLQWFGLSQLGGQWALISVAVVVLVVLAIAMKHLALGRFVYAVGSDAEAARLAGIRPQLTTFGVFVFMGALTGLAAMMNVVQSPQVDPKSGTGLELKVIAAVVVGGVAISGGRGNLWGVFVGLLLLACISPALTHLHVEAYWEKAIQGAIILLAVVADGVRSKRERN